MMSSRFISRFQCHVTKKWGMGGGGGENRAS